MGTISAYNTLRAYSWVPNADLEWAVFDRLQKNGLGPRPDGRLWIAH